MKASEKITLEEIGAEHVKSMKQEIHFAGEHNEYIAHEIDHDAEGIVFEPETMDVEYRVPDDRCTFRNVRKHIFGGVPTKKYQMLGILKDMSLIQKQLFCRLMDYHGADLDQNWVIIKKG